MMKRRIFSLFLTIAICTIAFAQKGQDFSGRFLDLCAADSVQLNCHTVSPMMMDRILLLDTLENDQPTRQVLQQIKTIRIVSCENEALVDTLYEKALRLAKKNKRRYSLLAKDDQRTAYIRKRYKVIVELVMISKLHQRLNIISLTGNMNDQFIKKLTNLPENHNLENKEE